jgi:hypothetical protein
VTQLCTQCKLLLWRVIHGHCVKTLDMNAEAQCNSNTLPAKRKDKGKSQFVDLYNHII